MHIEYFRKYLHVNQRNIESFLFFSILLFLPTQFGKHFWPPYSFVLGQRIDYLSPTLYLTDMLIILLFVVYYFGVLSSRAKRGNLISLRVRAIASSFFLGQQAGSYCPPLLAKTKKKWWIFLVLFFILNIFLSQSPQESLYGLLKLFEIGFLTYYTGNILRRNLKIMVFPLAFGIISESLLAMAQFFTQGSLGGILYYFGERTFTSVTPGIANTSINGQLLLRPYATFSHPNVLAGYLVIGMTMLMCHSVRQLTDVLNLVASIFFQSKPRMTRAFTSKTLLKSFFYSFTLLLGTIGLCFTLSRVASLVWFFVCVFLLIRYMQKKLFTKKILLIANGLLGIVVVTLFIISPLLPRFSQLTLQDEAVVLREQLAFDAFTMLFSHPVFGVGLHNFLIALPHYDFSRGSVFSIQPVHNIFLLIGAETGFVGLWLFVSFVIWLYLRLLNVYKQTSSKKKLLPIILVTEVVILGSFDHYFLTIQQGQLLLGLVIGCVLSIF